MRTIYLHIGRGKTGTTTIQKFLAVNRARLLKLGTQYLLADDGGRGRGHQEFGKSFVVNAPEVMTPARRPDRVRKQIGREIVRSKAERIVISSENLAIADPALVREYFDSLSIPCVLKIILFARSQDELAESEYNQLVKLKRETRTFGQYVQHDLEGCDFLLLAKEWEAHFGRENIACRIYDGAKKDVVKQFLSCIGLEDYPSERNEVTCESLAPNASMGFKVLVAMRLLNGLEIANRPAIYSELLQQMDRDDLPALLFDSDEARAFRAQYAESNRGFTERYLGIAQEDLGGRRYSDEQRDEIRKKIQSLRLDSV